MFGHMTERQLHNYMQIGGRFAGVEVRSWFNPLRYILGKFYFVAL